MSTTRSLALTSSIAGLEIAGVVTRTGTSEVNADVSVGAAQAGTLTTRTDDDTGQITMVSSSHELIVGDEIDVFWFEGIRRGMLVSAVSGTLVTVGSAAPDIGIGDVFPIVSTVMAVSKQYPITIAIPSTKITMAVARATSRCAVEFQTASDVLVKMLDLCKSGNLNEYWDWYDLADTANPFGADVAKLVISNGSIVTTNFRFGALLKA